MLLSPEASVGERLAFAIWADAFIALWLAISVGLLARHRFFTPEDIDGGGLTVAQTPRTFCNRPFKTRWNSQFWQC